MSFSDFARSRRLSLRLVLAVSAAVGPGWSCSQTARQTSISLAGRPEVTREECIAIAEAYRTHSWTPQRRHAWHGLDRRGIRVDTPDVSFHSPDGVRPGWWIPGRPNTGMPYQWGGFDTPESFDRALARGAYAGDIFTPEKRRLLEAGISEECCGIDCSGFISRCWKLPRSYSTRELPSLCVPLPSWDDLRPGDLLNRHNDHALLFYRYTEFDRSRFEAYEAGSPPSWKVLRRRLPTEVFQAKGFRPFRYRGMRIGGKGGKVNAPGARVPSPCSLVVLGQGRSPGNEIELRGRGRVVGASS